MNPKKATGQYGIPPKIINLFADVIDKRLTNITNTDFECSYFSENGKIVSAKPVFKKENRSDENDFRPVSILNGFSKIYEHFINDELLNNVNGILSNFFSAYRNKYSSNHMITRLIEEWKEKLDKALFAGTYLRRLTAYLTILNLHPWTITI